MKSHHYYTERLYYLDPELELKGKTQSAIDLALKKNGAVGVAGGYYKEGLPFCFISDFMIIILGYSDVTEFAEATEGKLLNLIWPDDRQLFNEDVFMQASGNRKYRILTKEGIPIWANEIKSDCIDESGIRTWIISLRNIDVEYKREEKLRKQIEITKSLGSFYFAIYSLDIEKNQYTEVITQGHARDGVPPAGKVDELLERVCSEYVTSEYQDEMRDFFQLDTLRERIGDSKIISHVYKGVIQRGWCRASLIVEHRDEQGRIIRVTYASQNIDNEMSAELETQNKLRLAVEDARRANAAKSDFLSRMSHDIRTPINGIMGMLEIIKKNKENRKQADDCISKIGVSASYLLALINDVLDMNKLESGKIELSEEPFHIRELLESCYQIEHGHGVKQGVSLEMKLPEEPMHEYLLGSPLHIRHILLNIISNCIKYNKPGGKVLITVKEKCTTKETAVFQFVIEDTGIGMSKEFLGHIFDAFSQEDDSASPTLQGSGLGMSIVKRLIDKMGGEIVVESEKNIGSRFTFWLPCKIDPNPPTSETRRDEKEGDISQMKILLVEDNKMNLEIAQFVFEDAGAIITSVENGQAAVDAFCASEPGDFDVILMDIMMPVMNGLKATETIRKSKKPHARTIPIIAMTANAFAEDVRKCKEAGMNEHISKPLDVENALRIIAKYRKK